MARLRECLALAALKESQNPLQACKALFQESESTFQTLEAAVQECQAISQNWKALFQKSQSMFQTLKVAVAAVQKCEAISQNWKALFEKLEAAVQEREASLEKASTVVILTVVAGFLLIGLVTTLPYVHSMR